ncbi:unnamed protein product [Cylicocyclus nassatus]|uniref:Bestrophin homolog n=1 Tax=Cylicocyclus nassatus TaxID=53992 RepID=A0AA36MB25_CYLNA|nr:unnamed protein product [Cylicocyclus nassatus]
MTVSYNLDVSSVTAFSFVKVLFRWRGSIWKQIVVELVLWLCGYYAVLLTYRLVLDENAKRNFERIAAHCDERLKYIPLTFMLGFFVTAIIDRWRNIFQNMGWIENLALTVATLLKGKTLKATLWRRAIIRYTVLSQVLVLRDVSMRVRRRFPNMESLVVAGFLHENELRDLENINLVYNKYWAPVNWSLTVVMQAFKEGCIETLAGAVTLLNEIKNFRTNMARICNYDWVPIPIAYPQVVFLAVRVYFIICLVSRQFIIGNNAINKSVIDLYVPFMTVLEFIFFIGWMKVAEALLNPLGEDDDDFECNFLIDKNIATGMAIVDNTYGVCPQLMQDQFTDPNFQPIYSEESHKKGTDGALQGSAEGIELAKSDHVEMVAVSRSPSLSRKKPSLTRKIRAVALGVPHRTHSIKPLKDSPVTPVPPDSPLRRPITLNFQRPDVRALSIVAEESIAPEDDEEEEKDFVKL